MSPALAEYSGLLNQALEKLPNQGGTVYRGLGAAESAIARNWEVGEEISFDAFTSASRSIDEADEFRSTDGVSLVINSKSGKAVEAVSLSPNELELLFKSGSNFRVDQVTYRARFDESDPLIREIVITEI